MSVGEPPDTLLQWHARKRRRDGRAEVSPKRHFDPRAPADRLEDLGQGRVSGLDRQLPPAHRHVEERGRILLRGPDRAGAGCSNRTDGEAQRERQDRRRPERQTYGTDKADSEFAQPIQSAGTIAWTDTTESTRWLLF